MAAVDLVELIDLSLGTEQPSGVVNFNYLQVLLHEIVKRLAAMEQNQIWEQQQIWQLGSAVQKGGLLHTGTHHGPSESSLPIGEDSVKSHFQQKDDKSLIPTTGAHESVPSGTAHVTTGVPPGVTLATGTVPTGVAGTIPTGVTGTVPTGVAGTVPAGVTGTVPAGVAGTVPPGAALATGTVPGVTGTVPDGTVPTGVVGTVPTGVAGTVPTGVTGTGTGTVPTGVAGTDPTGVAGTVPAGVAGTGTVTVPIGVAGTVPTGVVGTVPTGVAGTVPAGVAGTVPAGVAGTVPTGVAPGANFATGTVPTGAALAAGTVPPVGVAGSIPPTGAPLVAGVSLTSTASGINGKPTGPIPRPLSNLHSKTSIVSAANNLGALERKIQNLESRVNSFETLPELLERKASDISATPVRDMWNYTNLNKRVLSTEDGLDKASQLFDDVLGEVQNMKAQIKNMEHLMNQNISDLNNKVSASTENLEKKLQHLESFKLSSDSDGSNIEPLMIHMNGLQEQLETLQNNSSALQEKVESLEQSLADALKLEDSFKLYSDQTNEALNELKNKLNLCASEQSTVELNQKVLEMDEQLANKIKELESILTQKVNVSDLASMMPTSDGSETANFMGKLLELQTKLTTIESKQPSLPTDVMEKITTMQSAIDYLTNQLTGLDTSGSGADSNRVEELGLHVAQIRERLSELDRAVSALSTAVSQKSSTAVAEDKDATSTDHQYADAQNLNELQQLVNHLQEEQERLMGTVANISHELEIDKEHTKSLYTEVDKLKAMKADKEQVAIEVEEKADRAALEGKASRDWVDSTFERLDREIREAKSHLVGQEEAFRSAMNQINEDVDGKLDRMELEPLKNYFDKKINRLKTTPMAGSDQVFADDAAGFKKPLRFRCISCDKPVGIKPNDVIPALPQVEMLPGVRSFRPYTTYELELIRRHQRMGQYSPVPLPSFPSTFRSAGGSHTMTRPHQRVRTTPLSSVYMLETSASSPPAAPVKKGGPSIHDEMNIVGHDGHIYKGRASVKQFLPEIPQSRSAGRNRISKPPPQRPSSTTPPIQQQTVQS